MELTATAPVASASRHARHDTYRNIHKALRALMFDTLARIGRVDIEDREDLDATLARLDRLLAHLRSHVAHENEFIHAAIEARRPSAAQTTAGQHVEHLASIAALADEAQALRAAAVDQRPPLALRLYRHLALFIAENLEHMHFEETTNNATLWALYSDAELDEIHGRLVAHLDPRILTEVLGWMAAALNPQELAELVIGMQREAPPEAMRAALAEIRPRLDERCWARLARAIGLPPAPGLVEA
ncbi:hypothetical protein [Rivibacter subsaxonicus]|uniref:Hemerythrin HHE cation binding domain-containing protein n=1 Tax=Rivibacter subsaxonicus TaxID=457575 RepID=A0A4Q7W2N5_9BURK|nr:hypothetical protein [Rivibacter subsaxonicus]RZU02959.1 hypothetical protein EV670_0990 [Rivibacter subsaxonicus]